MTANRAARRFTAAFCFVLIAAASASLAEPVLTFTDEGIIVGGVEPGAQLAWIGMIRDTSEDTPRVKIVRGIRPASPDGKVTIESPGADRAAAVWAVADLGRGAGKRSGAPGYSHTAREIRMRAVAGQPTFEISSAAAEVLYVRPRRGAWTFFAGDGAGIDADGRLDGIVTVNLATMDPFEGNPHPPETVQAGDIILAIDPYDIRVSQLEVAP
jgi:hypothetical protein